MRLTIAAIIAMWVSVLGGCDSSAVPRGQNAAIPPVYDALVGQGNRATQAIFDDAELNYDPVQQEQAKGFDAWVVNVPGAIWGAAVSAEERQRYADIQSNSSAPLLAFEQARDRYSRMRGILLATNICRLRNDAWAMKAGEGIDVSQRADQNLQATWKALSPIEVDTADAFSVYIAIMHAQFLTGTGPNADCASLATMPVLMKLDQFVGGETAELPLSNPTD